MKMNLRQFKDNLLAYGGNVHKWPAAMREAGLKALESFPELRPLLADEERFERLLNTRKYEEPSSDLAQRIISASQSKKKKLRGGLGGLFSELVWEFSLPTPALTAVSVLLICFLMIGFAIGFLDPFGSVSTEQYETNLQEFLYYEGEVL